MADWDWGMKKTGKSNADSRERVSYLVLKVTFWFSLFHLCPGLNAAAKFSIYVCKSGWISIVTVASH